MGNVELKNAFKNALKDQQSKDKLGLTPEILLEDQLIKEVLGYITQKMNVGDSISLDLAFPERNSQVNENAEENYKRQYIAELNEQYITGFATPQGNLEILKEPGKFT